ncbi:hypothetical protein C8R44DRAFT_764391 [Mycena epipterygia]|nr:hypothetical protein C8R44DRAFT_764391 [Mycena epipterygia]
MISSSTALCSRTIIDRPENWGWTRWRSKSARRCASCGCSRADLPGITNSICSSDADVSRHSKCSSASKDKSGSIRRYRRLELCDKSRRTKSVSSLDKRSDRERLWSTDPQTFRDLAKEMIWPSEMPTRSSEEQCRDTSGLCGFSGSSQSKMTSAAHCARRSACKDGGGGGWINPGSVAQCLQYKPSIFSTERCGMDAVKSNRCGEVETAPKLTNLTDLKHDHGGGKSSDVDGRCPWTKSSDSILQISFKRAKCGAHFST